MKTKDTAWVLVLVAMVIAGGAYYFTKLKRSEQAIVPQSPVTPSVQAQPSAPAIKYPVPVTTESAALQLGPPKRAVTEPADPTEASLFKELSDLLGADRLNGVLNLTNNMIRKLVVTIDNATAPRLPAEFSPVRPAFGKFAALGKDEDLAIDPANEQRYQLYSFFAMSIDWKKVVPIYVRYYPLFQQAYAELGTSKYFNDRLVEVIDSLLGAPTPPAPIKLVRTGAAFKYADPKLEELPVGQKILVRMGPSNAERIKTSLRQLRSLLVGFKRTP